MHMSVYTASNGIVKWLGNEKGTSPHRRGPYIYVYYIIRVYTTCASRHLRGERSEREGVRGRERNDVVYIYTQLLECDALARVSE